MPKEYFSQISDHKSPPTYKFFNGVQWIDSLTGKTTDIISPIDGNILGRVQQVSPAEIDQAIDRAKKAQKEWAEIPVVKRAKILHLVSDWIKHHEHYLTTLLINEIGKNLTEAKDEIFRSADMIEAFANEALNLTGEQISGGNFPDYDGTRMAIVERVPLGIILAISPFNYPVNLSVSKIAPALMTGNAVVFKPPTHGSISGLHLTDIFRLAGLPEGLLTTVTGGGSQIGDYLVTHRDINMVAFTGSSAAGKYIAAKVGMVPMLLECGGNNPALVLPDADMKSAAAEIVKGAFSFSGQRCTALKYVLGFDSILEKLIPMTVEETKRTIRMGDPRIQTNNLGPLISDEAAQEVEKKIIMAKAHGAKIIYGGKREGRYMEPTVIDDASPFMEIVQTETFGPVLSFIRIKSMEEALKIINDSDYGLQVSVFTADEGTGLNLAGHINTGTVQINSKPQRGPDNFPFLGIKGSGLGVQGIRYSLEAMTRLKPVILNKPQ